MALPISQVRITIEEYIKLERQAEECHECLDRVVYAIAVESPEHGIISVNLMRELSSKLRGGACQTFTKDTEVRCGPDPESSRSTKGLFAYPD